MKKTCDIFFCYRGKEVLLPKLFSRYIDRINKDQSDKRNFGKVWFSDLEAKGNYVDEEELFSLMNSAKYFVLFIFSGFTQGFFDENHQLVQNCVTAKELIVAEKVRQKRKNTDNELIFIGINMNGESFNEQDVENLRHLFLYNHILREDTISEFVQLNKNNFDLRQGSEELFFNRILEGLTPKIISDINILTFDGVPDNISERDIYLEVNKFVLTKTLLNSEWGDEISSEFFLLCLAKELDIDEKNLQYIELFQRVSERLTEKIDTGDFKIEERHNKRVFEETEQIIELMKKDDAENGIYRNTSYIHYGANFFG